MKFVIIILMMLVFMFMMRRTALKTQQKQKEMRDEAITIGNNVVTSSGFFGRIVDIDGDAVTLESPSGDETVWMRSAIMSQMDIPLAVEDEDETYDTESETDVDIDTDSVFDDGSDSSDNQGSAWK
ncbi:preprotein translocase subunit YajC [Arcanobacterium buesumense]|uniref:Preprotein translocase subunit YajC n=1 Tax=Arcanobacterium buesumense TaxID=2722751 RepID=A0A6H2EL68_9ACTO|nr:preprotein translocase subunit YajC [Arcanobacterium buesumense]QJC21731.1 preprotein translocase subunit YajC [Arcanobacterium buesumense]